MILRNLPLKKGRDVAGHNISLGTKCQGSALYNDNSWVCNFSARPAESPIHEAEPQVIRERHNGGETLAKKDQFSNRDFFLSVLGSSATKREARAYLQRFKPETKSITSNGKETSSHNAAPPAKYHGVNLGSFYGPRAVHNSPIFMQRPENIAEILETIGPLHLALVKIRVPQNIEDDTLAGVGRTLSQLGKLGLTSTVVVDCDESSEGQSASVSASMRSLATQQVDRVVAAIDSYGEPGARKVDEIISISEDSDNLSTGIVYGRTYVNFRKLLMAPLKRGVIPVIPAIGYGSKTQRAMLVKADDVVLTLAREFAGLQTLSSPEEDPVACADRLRPLRNEVSLDRLIILDPLGGIPTAERPNGYHVFLNMEQEFIPVRNSLFATSSLETGSQDATEMSSASQVSDLARGNPFSRFVETELASPFRTTMSLQNITHLENLELVRDVLSLLPPTSSALLTTPMEAATSGRPSAQPQSIGVGTRRLRNALIHNLLTDKPVYSSSLPAGRLGQPKGVEKKTLSAQISPTTFAKRGMSVSVFPDPRNGPWEQCVPGQTRLSLTDSRIDLPRLVHLIDDSFNRMLDVQEYLERVNDRIAGVIIAGEYEGGALFTWELPLGVPDDGSDETRARMVPYLDKFAVLKRSQGAGGVADILFKTMVKDCFPGGVCWRSRRDNPVNKWYFERSRGTWKIPDTNWTMFWTTPGLCLDPLRFSDYEGVCKSIVPSWADNKNILD